jgi:hypothetical protein
MCRGVWNVVFSFILIFFDVIFNFFNPQNVKAKFFLCLIKHNNIRRIWEWRHSSTHSQPRYYMEVSCQLHVPAAALPEKEPGIRWIGGWVGPRAGLDAVAKRKIPVPGGNRTPVVQPTAWTLYWPSYPEHTLYRNFFLCNTQFLCSHPVRMTSLSSQSCFLSLTLWSQQLVPLLVQYYENFIPVLCWTLLRIWYTRLFESWLSYLLT